jgi:tripartite-type tricarboxylate transporter receptor subunit TctC
MMRRRPAAKGVSRLVLAVASAGAVALAVSACATGSAPASASGSPAGSGAADTSFYHGKSVNLIVPSAPGGSIDEWGRLLAPYMSQYLHATVKVVSVPAGNTIVGQNEIASAAPNGLTFGILNVSNDVELTATKTSGLTFNPADLPVIGATPGTASGIFALSNTPYKTFADLQHAGSSVTALTVSSGTNDLVLRTILGAYGINVKYITGYENTADLAAGFLRGDGSVTAESVSSLIDPVQDGKVLPLMVAGTVASDSSIYQEMKTAPTLAEAIKQNPPSSATGVKALTALMDTLSNGLVVAAPKGTPSGYVAALSAAMKWTMAQPSLKTAAAKQSLSVGFIPGSTAHAGVVGAFENAPALAAFISH